jgi:integrase/recombinase XerD
MAADIHGFESRLRNQFDNLEDDYQDDKISDGDYHAIREFSIARDQEEGIQTSSVAADLSTARTLATRCYDYYDIGFTDMTGWPDVREFMHDQMHDDDLGRGGGGISKGTSARYRGVLRKLLLHQEYEWAEEIDTNNHADYSVDREKHYLSPSDRQTVLEHARNERDRALIALMRETGQRIGALGTLRVKDIETQPKERYGVIHLNTDALGLKGAKGPRHITTSRPYVERWMSHLRGHDMDDSDAPFFTSMPQSGTERGENIKYTNLRERVLFAAEDAGVDDPSKFRPHNWRHSAITDMIARGYSEAQIKYIAGWSKDSSLFEVYDENTEEQMMKSVLKEEGLYEEDEDDERQGLGVTECPNPRCRESLAGTEEFCPSCGDALTQNAVNEIEDSENTLWEGKSEAESESSESKGIDALREVLNNNPEVVSKLLNEAE